MWSFRNGWRRFKRDVLDSPRHPRPLPYPEEVEPVLETEADRRIAELHQLIGRRDPPWPPREREMTDDQRRKIIGLLETAEKLALDLDDGPLAYQIGVALDEARAGVVKQAPYFPDAKA